MMKAEQFYRSREAVAQPYPANVPMPEQYYGQPAYQTPMQPYEEAYPVASPGFIEEIQPERKRRPGKQPGERSRERRTIERKSPWPMLLALLALTGVIILAGVLIFDMLKAPPSPVLPPSSTNPGTTAASKAPVISNIQFKDITRTGATVTWTTDKKSNSIVVYCLEGGNLCENAKDDTLVTAHSVVINDMEPGKAYHVTVKSMVNDLDATQDAPFILRTGDVPDAKPPVISDVKVINLVGSSATISWATDEPATSQVAYGTTVGYGTSQPERTDTTLLKPHEVILNGLAPNTTFHFKVISRDASGNEAASPDKTFVTPAPVGSMVGNSAPDFTLDCADGSKVTLSALRGKKVIVNFWNTSCHYCMEEMPYIQTVRTNNQESALAVLAINTSGGFPVNRPEQVGAAVTQGGYTFTVPMDKTGQVANDYNVTSGIPVTFFIDSNGTIKVKQDGAFSSANDIQSKLSSY